jgi:hypothetical protein
MTREEFVERGHIKGLVHDTLNGYPEEWQLVGLFDILLDPTVIVHVLERTVNNMVGDIYATAYWRDPNALVQDGYVSVT